MVAFDVAYIFTVFKGPAGLLSVLDKYVPTHGLSYNTVQMWSRRGSIPSWWQAAVLYAAEKEGHTPSEFMTDPDEFSGASARG